MRHVGPADIRRCSHVQGFDIARPVFPDPTLDIRFCADEYAVARLEDDLLETFELRSAFIQWLMHKSVRGVGDDVSELLIKVSKRMRVAA